MLPGVAPPGGCASQRAGLLGGKLWKARIGGGGPSGGACGLRRRPKVQPVGPCLERGVTGRLPVGLCSPRGSSMAVKGRSLSSAVEQVDEPKVVGMRPLEGLTMFGNHLRYRNAHGPQLPSGRRASQMRTQSSADGASAVPPEEGKFLGVASSTWKKVIPLGFMLFCILFNYTILRDTKDVLVVTAPGSGAEIIPFLKTWVNLPLAIGFTVLYAKLANILNNEQLFYTCIFPFIAFFGAFAFFLYPLRDVLHPTAFSERLLETAGPRFAGPIAILRNWTFCLFYVMAELWGSVVVSVLFWGFANQITNVDEATQFYPLFGLGANVALIFSGRAVKYFSQVRANLPPGVDGWGVSLKGLMSMVVVGGLIIAGTFYWMNRKVVPMVEKKAPKKKKKPKMSVGESFAFLLKSRYIRDLATLVIAYGVSINLVEVTWKSKIKAQFPNPNDYSAFMGDFSSATGTVTLLMMLASRFIFQKFGWGVAALITPVMLLVTGAIFFGLILFGGPLEPALEGIGMTPLYLAVLVGAAQNIFSKSAKYSLFDPCKETAYIPLDDEVRTKGKAAIDVICNPLGKSGGALIQQMLILGLGSLAASVPYLGAILLAICGCWILAARSLDVQFTELQKDQMRSKLKAMKAELAASKKDSQKLEYHTKATEEGFAEGDWVPVDKKGGAGGVSGGNDGKQGGGSTNGSKAEDSDSAAPAKT